jgi:hypothetical protein
VAYEGEGTYSALKFLAVVNVVLATVAAIAVWAQANEPRLEFDSLGNPTVATNIAPDVVALGAIILGEGILLALILWALGTMGLHVIALRREIAPLAEAERMAFPAPPTPAAAADARFNVVLSDIGTADPQRIKSLVREYSDGKQDPGLETIRPAAVIASGLTYASAEPLRASLQKNGSTAELQPEGESS